MSNTHRKQIVLETKQLTRLSELVEELGTDNESKIIRMAIDAFDPKQLQVAPDVQSLIDLAFSQVKEASALTQETVKRAEENLKLMEAKYGGPC